MPSSLSSTSGTSGSEFDDTVRVAIILPCFNEATAIAKVIQDFRGVLPNARIFVFDNNSTDDTVAEARSAGAIVRFVKAQGKGNVLRQAFALIDADVYVLADGDGTYDTQIAPVLIKQLLDDDLDMVIGVRRHHDRVSYRRGHVLGNWLFNKLVGALFRLQIADLFSGYRVFSRPFVKSFPALAPGFETETEVTLHAMQLRLPFAEVDTAYGPRDSGSKSKLNTFRDGLRILVFVFRLLRYTRPMFLFSCVASFLVLTSLFAGIPVVIEFLETGLVERFPTAIGAAALMVIAAVCFVTGLILDIIAYAQREQKRLSYLSISRLAEGGPET